MRSPQDAAWDRLEKQAARYAWIKQQFRHNNEVWVVSLPKQSGETFDQMVEQLMALERVETGLVGESNAK